MRRRWLSTMGLLFVLPTKSVFAVESEPPSMLVSVSALGDLRYRLRITQRNTGALLQEIEVRNGEDPALGSNLRIENHQGHQELWLLGGHNAQGDWYKIWRFDPTRQRFEWLRTTTPGERLDSRPSSP